jgi:hypothetical protein
MDKQPLRRLLFCLLLITALSLLHGSACAVGDGAYEKVAKTYENTGSASEVFAPIARPAVEYTSDDLRDPFQGVNTKPDSSRRQAQAQTKELPKMVVQGIMWGGKFNQAIINSKVVRAGDTIEGAQIIAIEKNKIILIFDNRKYTLSIIGESKAQEQSKEPVP